MVGLFGSIISCLHATTPCISNLICPTPTLICPSLSLSWIWDHKASNHALPPSRFGDSPGCNAATPAHTFRRFAPGCHVTRMWDYLRPTMRLPPTSAPPTTIPPGHMSGPTSVPTFDPFFRSKPSPFVLGHSNQDVRRSHRRSLQLPGPTGQPLAKIPDMGFTVRMPDPITERFQARLLAGEF